MGFKPNKRFKRDYDKIFKEDPQAANLYLLMCEIANKSGQVVFKDEQELAELMAIRFVDPKGYAL